MEEQKDLKDEEQKNGQPEKMPSRSYVLWVLAGLYLLYTGYSLCQGVIRGQEGSGPIFLIAGIVFLVIGAYLTIKGAKNLWFRDKEKSSGGEKTEDTEGQEAIPEETKAASDEKTDQRSMSIAERARLVSRLEEDGDAGGNDEEEN